MTNNKFVIGSDFKIKYELHRNDGTLAPIGSKPFYLKYYNPNDLSNFVIASFDGVDYVNMIPKENYYSICIEKPNFDVGRLVCTEIIKEVDPDFPDGFCDNASTYDVGQIVKYVDGDTVLNTQVNFAYGVTVGLPFRYAAALPAVGEKDILYFIPNNEISDLYIFENGKAVKVGNTTINMDNFFTKDEINGILAEYATLQQLAINLTNYYLKTETFSKEEINDIVSGLNQLTPKIVTSVDEVVDGKILYFIPREIQEGKNLYDQYMYIDGKPEKIGDLDTTIDLREYVLSSVFTSTINGLVNIYVAKETGKELIPATALLKLNDLPNANEIFLKSSLVEDFGCDSTKVMSQKAVTKNISQILQLEGEELWAYGVKWTQGQSSATLERIGSPNMHKTLPCHKTRGCLVKDDGTINYYLHDSTDFLKEDGVTPSVLDGSDGDVMNQRKFYYRTAIKDGVHVNWMSPYPLPGYTLYENLTGRYKASINRTTGKIHSVINNSPEYRGGNNNSAWDADGRSLLGCGVSSISRATLRNGARINRAVEWNGSPEHDDFFARLIYARIKWATHNFQLPFNPALDANGYYQGGMGSGTTNLSSAKWNGFNNYNPFIPCGYTAEFGNGSGVKDFVMPFECDGYNTTLSQQKYVGVYDSERVYAVGEYVSDSLDTYKGSGDALLYICIVDAPAGTLLTNTTYFSVVNRTVTQAIRMDGEEQWFGEIWEHYANVIIEHNADVEPKTSKAYIFHKPSEITETRTGNEEFLCDLPISDGYIREFNSNSIFPISVGGGSNTYGCDYYYCNYPASGINTRGCLGGGYAATSSNAGPSCSYSTTSPSLSYAHVGGRLVLKSKNRVIIDK